MKNIIYRVIQIVVILKLITICQSCQKVKVKASVETGKVENILTREAVVTGTIVNLGYGISEHGHCWSKNFEPTVIDDTTALGATNKIGDYTSHLRNLEADVEYHVRAYVKSDHEYLYGQDVLLITSPVEASILSTLEISSITGTSAFSGGIIESDGGGQITSRGVCWSTTINPTINNKKTIDGTGTGQFSSNITGLQPLITYYVRAYAKNSAGIAYGNNMEFTTPPGVPSLTTTPITDLTSSSAVSGGKITSDGCAEITAKGICWSTTQNPTTGDDKTLEGYGTDKFSSSLTGLTFNTLYYVRAYATNSAGTGYGNEISVGLWMNIPGQNVQDIDGNSYESVKIGAQTWMKKNLQVSHYRNGEPIPIVIDVTAWKSQTSGACCYFNNDPLIGETYGKLYNWHSVNDSTGLCPVGWHIPSVDEWGTLIKYLDGYETAGGKLKETGIMHWAAPNDVATNSSGFTALPGGYRDGNDNPSYDFSDMGSGFYCWTSKIDRSNNPPGGTYVSVLHDELINANRHNNSRTGFSVRCIKDN